MCKGTQKKRVDIYNNILNDYILFRLFQLILMSVLSATKVTKQKVVTKDIAYLIKDMNNMIIIKDMNNMISILQMRNLII